MSKRINVFEGIYNQYLDWKASMPIVMVKPVLQLNEDAGSIEDVDNMIEDYMLDIMNGDEPYNGSHEDYLLWWKPKSLVRMFYRSKAIGRKRQGWTYWKKIIEWDVDDTAVYNLIESVNCSYRWEGMFG